MSARWTGVGGRPENLVSDRRLTTNPVNATDIPHHFATCIHITKSLTVIKTITQRLQKCTGADLYSAQHWTDYKTG